MIISKTYIAVPPGATIKEQLIDRNMTQKEFAYRLNVSQKHISKLINGEVILTPEMAIKLEMVLGIPARYWNKLEALYRETILKANQENEMEEDIKISKLLPYSELVKLGWIDKANKAEDKVINLRKYFEVVNLSLISNININKIACRRQNETSKADYALIAWAQKAKLEARKYDTNKIDINKLQNSLYDIRKMTRQSPEEFCNPLIQLLSDCGIALVFLPHLKGSYLHGATFCDNNKIVIGLTVRGKDADKFWFSLFHELGHIIYNHIGNENGTSEQEEMKADAFASDMLISEEELHEFITNFQITKNSILEYSNTIGIDPGILVGRLQKKKIIEYTMYNDLKQKYEIN